MLPYGRKNPLPFPFFAAVTYRQSAPDQRFWKELEPRVSSHAAGGTLPLRFSEKLSARQGRTRLRQFAHPSQPVLKKEPPVRGEHAYAVRVPRSAGADFRLRGSHSPDSPMPRKRKRHRSRGASPFCGYVGRSAAAVAAITAAAAGIITTGTAGTAAAAALTAAYPDQDDQDDDPPPRIFAPEAVRRTHALSFPPIKDFITFYGKRPKMVTHSQFSIFANTPSLCRPITFTVTG